MMNKQKSGKMSHLKPLLALPLIALMAIAFSFSGALDVYGQDSPSGISKASDKELPPPPPPPKNQDVSSVSGVKSIGKEEAVFKEVAHMPEFKGGQEAFINYIRQNVNYPEDAKKAGIKGKVYVEFILNKSGKVSSAWIKKSVNPALDAEALRVVLNMPDWTPGRDESNKPVNVQMALPIVFSLE